MASEKLRGIKQQLTDNSAACTDAADDRRSGRFRRTTALQLAFVGAALGLELATSHIRPPGPALGLLLTFASVAGGAWQWLRGNDCVKACNAAIARLNGESHLLARQMRVEVFKR